LRREAIEQNLQKNKRRKDELVRFENESKDRLKKLYSHRFVYQQIEEKYQKTIVLPQLEEKKRKLK
jgi:hypothetical protein